ncbi:hypothetical protein AX660_16395 [Paraglaciecola hydrolytica]|uniref:Uncharacterized protein n=1 Tax=Paraglaciecola hydrolytica TaxID=1799789 RepID=A0A136A082_9ALTE|nr:hypothetical protein AX660_16395 [Paraglaciecola hydrolytica]
MKSAFLTKLQICDLSKTCLKGLPDLALYYFLNRFHFCLIKQHTSHNGAQVLLLQILKNNPQKNISNCFI